uniref:Zinc finger CCCH domain-containing protein 14 n=1 Tax=Clastoptera arizonana TaxID=38151 RepID=A0A1B6C1A4_9HEMI
MVMVGNKKSKSQMDEGLKLFLGSNTSHFTNWLHQVLQKLEEVTIPSLGVKNIGSSSSKKKSHNDPPKKKKKLKSSSKEKKVAKKFKNIIEEKYIKKEKDVSDNEIIEGTVANNTNQHTVEIVQSFDKNEKNTKEDELKESSGQIEAENSNSTTKEKFSIPIDADEDEFLNIRADIEADDLMEGDMESSEVNFDTSKKELPSKVNTTKNDEHSETENKKSNLKLRSVSPTNSDKESMNKLDARHLLNRRTDARELLNRKAAARLSINVKSSSTTSERRPLKRHYNDRSYDRHSSKRDLLSDDDRKNDRDTEKPRGVKRRSSEISDIQDKTHNRLNKILYSAREENSKRTKVSSSTSDLSKDEIKSRLRGCETEDKKRTGVLSRVVPLGRRGDDSSEVPIPSVIRVTPRPRRPLSEQANHKLIFKAMADANKSTASLQPRLDLQGDAEVSHIEAADALDTLLRYALQQKILQPEEMAVFTKLKDAVVAKC